MKLVAANWNSRFGHSNWVQWPWQEMKQTTWFGLAMSLSHCLGLHLYATSGAPSQMWGCLPLGRKVVTETTKLGNLRNSCDPSQLPLVNQTSGFFSSVSMRDHLGMPEMWQGLVHRYARWICWLSHQSSDLSHLCNSLQKVVICALLDTRLKGMQVVAYPTNCQTTKVILTKVFPKHLAACTWINKVNSSSWIYSHSMRGTNIARVEGWWLNNRLNCSVAETQTTAPKLELAFLIYFTPLMAWVITVTSLNDIMIVCSTFSVSKPLCMHRGSAIIHLCICQYHCWNPQLLQLHQNLIIFSLTWILCLWHI